VIGVTLRSFAAYWQRAATTTTGQKKMPKRQPDNGDISQTVSDSRTANSRVVKTCGA